MEKGSCSTLFCMFLSSRSLFACHLPILDSVCNIPAECKLSLGLYVECMGTEMEENRAASIGILPSQVAQCLADMPITAGQLVYSRTELLRFLGHWSAIITRPAERRAKGAALTRLT